MEYVRSGGGYAALAWHSRYCVALTKQLELHQVYQQTPLNWNTAEMRRAPLPK